MNSGASGLAANTVAAPRRDENAPAPGEGGGLMLLLVEDDESLGSQLERGLARSGYQVCRVTSGEAALRAAHRADLVLLDLGLPDLDGTEVCRLLRERWITPIIAVTARGEEPERVAVLDLGADDYLVKPFGFAELLARIRAVLRRGRIGGRGAAETAGSNRVRVDLRARRVHVDGAEVSLTPKEFDILVCLAEDPGRAVSREEIFERAWDVNWYGPTKVLDVHVAALRRKLGDPRLIQTVYGVGFRLDPADRDPAEHTADRDTAEHTADRDTAERTAGRDPAERTADRDTADRDTADRDTTRRDRAARDPAGPGDGPR